MRSSLPYRRALTGGLLLAFCAALLGPVGPTQADEGQRGPEDQDRPVHLNLGAGDLPEHRTNRALAPGVTLTKISRGGADSSLFWTAEVAIPSDSPDPDAPASALSSQVKAQATADKLKTAGVEARVEHVQSPQLADAGGDLGYRVRAGQFTAKADGASTVTRIKAAGFASSVIYTGWDGDTEPSPRLAGPGTWRSSRSIPRRTRASSPAPSDRTWRSGRRPASWPPTRMRSLPSTRASSSWTLRPAQRATPPASECMEAGSSASR